MKKLLSIILVLQLLLVPAAASAQGEEEKNKQAGETISADFSVDSKPKLSLEGEANYQEPSNYPLKNNGELIDVLIDSYGVNHYTYFNNLANSPDNSEYMELGLLYRSNQSSAKDGLLTIEFYKEATNSLSYVGGSDFPVAWFTEATLGVDLQKSYFADQRYLYMRIGTSQNSSDTYYSDVTLFKVENPFASVNPSLPPDQYAVISNESVDAETAQSSGTFDVKEMKYTKDSSLKPSAYKVDYDKPFDSSSNKGRLLEKNTKSINSLYSVGDYKNFWVSNLTTNANEQINARLAYSGTKANVWVHNNQITDSDAGKLGVEFDSKIHSSVTNHFGPESDVNHDGKINILTYDIQDGFSGSGGYVAGYFWAGDLYNVPGSNMSEIFYIDTYPAMGMGSVKDVTSSYETLAHEFQHMVNFNRNALIEGGGNMDTWLNESLSMAAEQIYTGYGLEDRVNYYNVSEAIQNGHSLLYWDRYGDTLSNYSLSYLFGQYIKIQAGIGDEIFKEILEDPKNDYAAVENAAKKYIDPNMTFGKLMTNFRIALLLKERDGLRGFKGDPFFDSLNEKIFNGNSVNLRGGGSVVTAFNSEEGFEEPAEKGADITYTILDMTSGETDTTPPSSPVVNQVGDADSAITGKAEANAAVYAIAEGSEIGRDTANQAGDFQLSISPQIAGTRIEVYAMDQSGNVSEPAIVTVEDVTVPGVPQVNNVTDQDLKVTGTAELNSSITVKIGLDSWTGKANTAGQFSVAIPKQQAGTQIEVTAKDDAGNVSAAATVTVADKTPPAAPAVNKVTDQSTAVTGTAENGSEVTVKIGTESWKGTTNTEGHFSITIPKQKAGTIIEVTAKDTAGNASSSAKVTVVDGTPPNAPMVNTVSDRNLKIYGTAEPGSTISVRIGTSEIGKGAVGESGFFAVEIHAQQNEGTELVIIAFDAERNASSPTKVKVIKGDTQLSKLVGKTRYTTAVEISKKGWSASDTIFLVNGWAIADGLTATPLASAKNAPILLAATNSLPEETMSEIKRLKTKNIVLIGGSGVISDGVKNSLSSQGYSVSRIGGKTRYETSLKIAQELDKLVDVHTVYMAYGHGEPDALSISAQSGQTKQPIILTEKKAVPANTYQWLKGEGLQTSYFIGGKGVIYPAIITEMNSITAKSVVNNRLSGVNRQETNAKVIQAFYKQDEMPTIMVAHASTTKLVDALAAGPLAAKYNVPVLLVSNKLDSSQVNVIKGKYANDVHQIGGGIGDSVLKQVVDLMN